MAKIVPLGERLKTVREVAEKFLPKLEAMIPKTLSAPGVGQRFMQVFLQDIPRNPDLLDCNPRSLVGAFLQASALGLEVGGALGHAYLVPFKDEVTLIVGYRGFITLADRSGKVSTVEAAIVRKADKFSYARGTKPFIEHHPQLLEKVPASREAGEKSVKAAYCVVTRRDGHKHFEVLSLTELLARRGRSRAKRGPWYGTWQDFEAMCMKTPTRTVLKYTPMSTELHTAVGIDEQGEAGLDQGLALLAEESEVSGPGDAPLRKKLDHIADDLEKKRAGGKAGGKKKAGKPPAEDLDDQEEDDDDEGSGDDL